MLYVFNIVYKQVHKNRSHYEQNHVGRVSHQQNFIKIRKVIDLKGMMLVLML